MVPGYIIAQFIGAFLGAVIVYVAYLAHWAPTEDPAFKLGVFCTGPGIRNTPANVITEIIGTAVLVFGVLAIVATFSEAAVPSEQLSIAFSSTLSHGRRARVEHRPVPGWADGLRDQPGSRPWPAHRPRDPADRR